MIGIHGRPRRVEVDQCDCSSRGTKTGTPSNTGQNKAQVVSLEHTAFRMDASVQESSNDDPADSNALTACYHRCIRSCSGGALSSSNQLQLSTEAVSAGHPIAKEQNPPSRVFLTLLDQSISDPFYASGCLGKSEVRLLHHCLWLSLSDFYEFKTNSSVVFQNVLRSRRKDLQLHQRTVYRAVVAAAAVRYSIFAKATMHLGMVMTISDNLVIQEQDVFREYTSTSLIYKGQATRLIFQSLSTVEATSDPIFFAILDMVCCYTSVGEADEVRPHTRGLKTLLKLRGGISELPPFLAYRVIRADNTIAAMTGDLPIVDTPDFFSSYLYEQLIVTFESTPRLDISALYTLLALAFDREDYVSQLSPSVLLFARHLLLQSSLYYETICPLGQSHEPFPELHMTQCIHLATLIYIEINLVNTWRFSTVLASLVRLLKESLERTTLTTFWSPSSNVLLLVLLLGGIGGAGRLQRAWFVERQSDMALGITLTSSD